MMESMSNKRIKKVVHTGEVGRPRIEFDPEELEKLAYLQCTDLEIALWFGCSVRTIERKRAEDPQFCRALNKGGVTGKISTKRQFFKQCEKGNVSALIFAMKNLFGWGDNSRVEHTGPGGGPLQIEERRKTLLVKLNAMRDGSDTEVIDAEGEHLEDGGSGA